MIEYSVLFVCTGNTCRSPMAEGLARAAIARRHGVSPDDEGLASAGVRVRSAGVSAYAGARASPEAVEAAKSLGADLSNHRSQPLTEALVQDADVIYTMTARHRDALLVLSPGAAAKTHPLDPAGDIADPFGQPLPVYQQAAEMIRDAVERRLEERFGAASK